MINAASLEPRLGTKVLKSANRESLYQRLWHVCLVGLALLVAAWLWQNGPELALLAWIIYFSGVVAILFCPRYGVYQIAFFSLIGDLGLMYWYPFEKNLSSAESLLYLHDSLIFSPLESYIALTAAVLLCQIIIGRNIELFAGDLLIPALLFGLFLVTGLLYGVGTGGSSVIALWESRPIFYLPVMLILTSNLIQKRGQIKVLFWLCMGAIFIESLVGTYTVLVELAGSISSVDRLTEHSASIHANSLFIFAAAAWLYRMSPAKRLALFLMIPTVALTYLASQRRAAFVTLAVALIILAIMLFIENRRLFFVLAPIVFLFAIAYIGVFWNSTSPIALPAQAIRSVIAPDPNSIDAASNVYRVIENVNVSYTVHQSPLFGVGFGQKFYIVISMADISIFDWWEYIVHNSIFWMWLKTGIFGFMSMLLLIGSGIMLGARVSVRLGGGELNAIALACTIYIMMHFLFAYVDMSWNNQSMIYVGVALGLLNCFEHVVAKPTKLQPKQWVWQPEPEPEPEAKLLPLNT